MSDISPVYARFVLRDMLRRGFSAEAILAGTSLDREALETGGDLAISDFTAILENARIQSGDETLGLMIGSHSNVVVLGAVGVAMAAAPSIRAGLQALESYSRLHASYVPVALDARPHGLSISYRLDQPVGEPERFHAEAAALLLQQYVEMCAGERLTDAEYRFAFPAPAYADSYRECLHSPVSFSHPHHSMELPVRWLDRRSPYYNRELWRDARAQLAERIRETGSNDHQAWTRHVRAILGSHEPPFPDLAAVAAGLHLSERTLNRRLQQEGSSYRTIRTALLQRWARRYLRETGHSVEAIAVTLGYQDAANFRRAFRSWEGCSPQEYRLASRSPDLS